jgi:uncharacterized protein (TIGR03435 family)
VTELGNHLWQSTLFAAGIAVACFAFRNNQARTRYWLWLAASLKFLVPFTLLIQAGSLLDLPGDAIAVPPAVVHQVNVSFMPVSQTGVLPEGQSTWWPWVLCASWLVGSLVVLSSWVRHWRRIHSAKTAAVPLSWAATIPILSSPVDIEPGIFGILKPVLLLPEGIVHRLTREELEAILAHELCHLERRDNLTAALHMAVTATFWFHPAVWWIGRRLIEERERACDEAVLLQGRRPEAYAQGILNVCKFYIESPLECAPGVTGSDLKKRIQAIMLNHKSRKLTPIAKALLATTGMITLAAPVLVGILNMPAGRAQPQAEVKPFEVASIRPSDPNVRRGGLQLTPDGGLNVMNMSVKQLIAFAYNLPCGKNCDPFILDAPGWADSKLFDVRAKGPQADDSTDAKLTDEQLKPLRDQVRQRLRLLLAERFRLVVRNDRKEMPVYELMVVRNGHKLKESAETEGKGGSVRGERGHMVADHVPMQFLVMNLVQMLGRPVIDRTGLTGRYDFTLDYAPSIAGPGPKDAGSPEAASEFSGPSIFTALQEQLGLKVEPSKGPVEILIVERLEQPTEN